MTHWLLSRKHSYNTCGWCRKPYVCHVYDALGSGKPIGSRPRTSTASRQAASLRFEKIQEPCIYVTVSMVCTCGSDRMTCEKNANPTARAALHLVASRPNAFSAGLSDSNSQSDLSLRCSNLRTTISQLFVLIPFCREKCVKIELCCSSKLAI